MLPYHCPTQTPVKELGQEKQATELPGPRPALRGGTPLPAGQGCRAAAGV